MKHNQVVGNAMFGIIGMSLRAITRNVNMIVNMALKKGFTTAPEYSLRSALTRGISASAVASDTYSAAVCTQLNKPLVVKQMPREATVPEGCVRVGIHCAGVNFADILTAKGQYQEKPAVPYVVGSEFSGEVLELGDGVTSIAVGDRVFGMGGGNGGFAEETILPFQTLGKLPPNVPYDVAASVMCVYGTAYMALTRKANIKPGETVLVTAAAGGVGMAAVDLASNVFNCKVIGACGDSSKCEAVKAQGASECIVYGKDNMRQQVKDLTDGNGVDIVFDAVGGTVFDECVRCVAFEGRLIVIGFASGNIPKIPANHLLVKSCTAVGVYWGSYAMRCPEAFAESITQVSKYLVEGKIHPQIGARFPLNQVNEAFQYIVDRKNIGKVVINTRE